MAHGISIQARIDGEIKTAHFASAIKCPELKGAIKKVEKLQEESRAAGMRERMFQQRLEAVINSSEDVLAGRDPYATEEGFQKKLAESEAANAALTVEREKATAIGDKMNAAITEFFRTGFLGAGYPEEKLESLLCGIDLEGYWPLRDRCLAGSGMVDFTKRDSN